MIFSLQSKSWELQGYTPVEIILAILRTYACCRKRPVQCAAAPTDRDGWSPSRRHCQWNNQHSNRHVLGHTVPSLLFSARIHRPLSPSIQDTDLHANNMRTCFNHALSYKCAIYFYYHLLFAYCSSASERYLFGWHSSTDDATTRLTHNITNQ